VTLISTSTGTEEEGGFLAIFSETGSHIINLQLALSKPDVRDRDIWEIGEDLRKELKDIPEIINYNIMTSAGMGGFGGNTATVDIYGYDIEQTTRLANELSERFKKIKGASNIQLSRKKEKPELQVVLDQEKMSQHGINTAMVSSALRNRVAGYTCTRFRESGDEFNVKVRFTEDYRNSISNIENIALTNMMGQKIKLKEIGKVEEFWSPPNIEHKRKERIVSVNITPYKTNLRDLKIAVEKEIGAIDYSDNIFIELGGMFEDQSEMFMDIFLLLIVSLLLVYIVMAAQFESLKMPIIIMVSILFAFPGVFIALFITGKPLSVIAFLGAVLLIGIVVKNAIVLVDYINLMRDRDYDLNEAIMISGKSRLRPVLMTALTTILGMMPMALSTGEGAEIWSPMGISVIGGLVFSTVVTMILVPVIYSIFVKRTEKTKKNHVRKRYQFMDNIEIAK
ncbi:efflux RND transporter permease subunit, partial [Bacteroidota bacterium]